MIGLVAVVDYTDVICHCHLLQHLLPWVNAVTVIVAADHCIERMDSH